MNSNRCRMSDSYTQPERRMEGLYGDLLARVDQPAGASHGDGQPQRTEEQVHSNGKRRREEPADGSDCGFRCDLCAQFVRHGSRAEHERGTLHRFNLFAEQPHPDRSTQAAAEPDVVDARNAAAAAVAAAASEAAQLAAQRQSVGYKMLKLAGWKEGEGLGRRGDGATAPVATRLVKGRPGLERHLAAPARVTHKPRSVKIASQRSDTPKAPGTRGERRAVRNMAVLEAKKEEVRIRETLSLNEGSCEGNSGPLWRASTHEPAS